MQRCVLHSHNLNSLSRLLFFHKKQKRSTEGCSKLKIPKARQVQERLVSALEPARPGVRRSKRPLLACRTRCICSMETLHNKVKSQIRL